MSTYIERLKHTTNGREIETREQVANVLITCEHESYDPKTAIWAGLTLLGEVAINLAVLADAAVKGAENES